MSTTNIQIQGTSTIHIQEMVRNTRERLEADFCKLEAKIHRFPRGLRPGVEERYIIPSFVSLGPYHHDLVPLRETEEVKHVAAHYFCEKSGHSIEEVYNKIFSIVGEARSCYADDAVANFTDGEFAVMMFLDGCYLLLYLCEKVGGCALLSLTPLFINDVTACWLVNMAAYEACVSAKFPSDGFFISSYISLLAMLMDREEDVQELRAKHLIRSFLSNRELLVFFKGLTRHLRLGHRCHIITDKIEKFKRERPLRIAVHRFVYNNFKTIVAVLSIASVLVGIFKTLWSLKQHQP